VCCVFQQILWRIVINLVLFAVSCVLYSVLSHFISAAFCMFSAFFGSHLCPHFETVWFIGVLLFIRLKASKWWPCHTVWNDLLSERKNSNISRRCFKQGPKMWLFDCGASESTIWWELYKLIVYVSVGVWSVRWSSSEVFTGCWGPAGVTASAVINTSCHSIICRSAFSAARCIIS